MISSSRVLAYGRLRIFALGIAWCVATPAAHALDYFQSDPNAYSSETAYPYESQQPHQAVPTVDPTNFNDCRLWARADYLLWWFQGNSMPALVTTSPSDTAVENAGVLGQPETSVLFGHQRIDDSARHGARLTLGYWLNDWQSWGVEGHYLYVGEAANGDYAADSTGEPILARPFFNVQSGAEDSLVVAYPGILEGQIGISTSSDLHSAGLLLRRTWFRDHYGELALVGGYRYFRYGESLNIDSRSVVVDPTGIIAIGTTLDVHDAFATQNDFHGGEIGLAADRCRGPWSLDFLAKLAMGNVHQQLSITGSNRVTVPGSAPLDRTGGHLARFSNIGESSNNRFIFLPELSVNLRYAITPSLSAHVGYTTLYLTDVLRTGSQIDHRIGLSGAPAPVMHPVAQANETSMWVQGMNVGIEWRF